MIDNYVRSYAFLFKVCDRGLKAGPRSLAIDRRYDDEPWMKLGFTDQFSKVARVLRYDDTIFHDAALNDAMIRFSPTASVKRVKGIVHSGLVKAFRDTRRE
jgi:hypothetical protein